MANTQKKTAKQNFDRHFFSTCSPFKRIGPLPLYKTWNKKKKSGFPCSSKLHFIYKENNILFELVDDVYEGHKYIIKKVDLPWFETK